MNALDRSILRAAARRTVWSSASEARLMNADLPALRAAIGRLSLANLIYQSDRPARNYFGSPGRMAGDEGREGMNINPKVSLARVQRAVQRYHRNGDNPGFCIACGKGADGCEPDARGYQCEFCGEPKVYGAEELLMEMV